jgi:hypothetical protein
MKENKNNRPQKILGHSNYSTIGHLPNSRLGRGEHHIPEGQQKIATSQVRDNKDLVIVQEKLDGANVGVVKLNNRLRILSRSGHDCETSIHPTHQYFVKFVKHNYSRFFDMLQEGERITGEWLLVVHGTKYQLPHEPFVAFDFFTPQNERLIYHDFLLRVLPFGFVVPRIIRLGNPISVRKAIEILDKNKSYHGALEDEKIEGLIYRIERNNEVDYLCKYVRPDKIDGLHLDNDNVILNEILPKDGYLLV